MSSQLITVIGTLSGTLIGALLMGIINYFSNRIIKNHEWRLAIARDQVSARQKLYAEFLVEVQRLVVQAREEKISSLTDLSPVNGKFAEICLIASEPVIKEAKKLSDYALTSESAPSAKEAADFFTLKEAFIAVARKDMAKVLSEA